MSAVERVILEPAFVLHGRAYRETSELLEVMSRDHGRVSIVARGMRRPRSALRALLQPFQPLLLSWSGRAGGLMTLGAAEPAGAAIELAGDALMSGFYLNELLLRFLHRGDPHPRVFGGYARALAGLGCGTPAPVLRGFELDLLAETGYGLNLDHDAASGRPLDPAALYQYVAERGPVLAGEGSGDVATYRGAELLAMGRGEFDREEVLLSARRLLRAVLDHHLAGQPLRTRQVVRAMRR